VLSSFVILLSVYRDLALLTLDLSICLLLLVTDLLHSPFSNVFSGRAVDENVEEAIITNLSQILL